jgi:hypothetical protein
LRALRRRARSDFNAKNAEPGRRGGLSNAVLRHDPEKHAPDNDPGWKPVFRKIMPKQQAKAKCRFNLKSFRFSVTPSPFA